jgi:hypothetical protein
VLPARKPRRPRLTPRRPLRIVREPAHSLFGSADGSQHNDRSVKPACTRLKGPQRWRVEHYAIMVPQPLRQGPRTATIFFRTVRKRPLFAHLRRLSEVSNRRKADIACRDCERRKWADSARSGVASGMTGVHAKAAVPCEREIRFDARRGCGSLAAPSFVACGSPF